MTLKIPEMIDTVEIKQLSNSKKIELINLIWDSLEEENGSLSMQEDEEEFVYYKIKAEDDGLLNFDSWENVKKRLVEKLN